MAPSHIRDVLASFSPSLDFFAMCLGDGRIKIWGTVKGQLQTEFTDTASSEPANIFGKSEGGHLSIDYTCMKWLSLDKKKKRKLGSSILVLGTGGGDVLALDVSAGQLKWRVNNCNPGGVNDVSFHANASHIYTAGADGMICIIDAMVGTLLNKFSAYSSAISSLVISPGILPWILWFIEGAWHPEVRNKGTSYKLVKQQGWLRADLKHSRRYTL